MEDPTHNELRLSQFFVLKMLSILTAKPLMYFRIYQAGDWGVDGRLTDTIWHKNVYQINKQINQVNKSASEKLCKLSHLQILLSLI